MILLLYFTKDEYIKNVYEEIQKFTKKISQRILQTQVFAVLSNRIENINMTPEMYQNCVILLQRLFFYGYCHVICQWEEQQSTTDFENIDIAHFRQAVWREDYDLIKKEANSLYVYLNTKVNVLPNIIKNIYFNMIYSIYEKAEKTSMSRFVQEEQDYLWEKINKLETIKECNEYLIENIDMLCNNRELLITDNKMVLKIIDYVKKNFMREEMSIKQIADSVFMSPAYLTTFFKKKTGKTIGQYIKEVRMEYAVFLLTEKGYSVCEISKFCGYSDANYFTKVFRKVYGMSPSEYKERR